MNSLNLFKQKPAKLVRNSRGVSIIEFTLILPFLLVLLFGIIEMSLLMYNQVMITNASREGARFGILFNTDGTGTYTPMTTAEISNQVNTFLADRLISFAPTSATTNVTPAGGRGQPLTVEVQYDYTVLILPGFAESLAGDITLSAETTMRME